MGSWYRKLQAEFYRGPVDLGIPLPRRRGYQSPTVTMALWIYAFGVRYFTMPGRAILTVLALILPLSMISLQMPVHLLGFSLLALFIVNIAVGYVVRPQLRMSRRLPIRVTAGTEVPVWYEVTNRRRVPCLDVHLDSLPWPAKLKHTRGLPNLAAVGPGETTHAMAWFKAEKRGVYMIPALRADSAFPFQLCRWGESSEAGPSPLLVYPRFTPLRRIALPVETRLQPAESGRHFGPGSAHEFAGCREFRPGDHTRRLHWRSWARTGYPVVKEYRDYHQIRGGMLLDTFRPLPWYTPPFAQKTDPVLEAGASFCAAAADFFQRQGMGVELMTVSRGAVEREALFDALACAHGTRRDTEFEPLAELLGRRSESVRFFIVVLLHWDDAREQRVRQWLAEGMPLRLFLVWNGQRPPAELPAAVTLVRADAVLKGQCTEI